MSAGVVNARHGGGEGSRGVITWEATPFGNGGRYECGAGGCWGGGVCSTCVEKVGLARCVHGGKEMCVTVGRRVHPA